MEANNNGGEAGGRILDDGLGEGVVTRPQG